MDLEEIEFNKNDIICKHFCLKELRKKRSLFNISTKQSDQLINIMTLIVVVCFCAVIFTVLYVTGKNF